MVPESATEEEVTEEQAMIKQIQKSPMNNSKQTDMECYFDNAFLSPKVSPRDNIKESSSAFIERGNSISGTNGFKIIMSKKDL